MNKNSKIYIAGHRGLVGSAILKNLENESIKIIRDTYLKAKNPVFLYSIGKDSSVLLHLFLKAFYPLQPKIKLLHIDTTWKFKEMIIFRDLIKVYKFYLG